MKLQRKADSRIPRTRAAIRKAYLGLLAQKDADAITVTDVAQAASLDRKTIYNYYASASAILDELENELVAKVCGAIRDSDFSRWLSDPFGYLDAVTRAFDRNTDLSAPLLISVILCYVCYTSISLDWQGTNCSMATKTVYGASAAEIADLFVDYIEGDASRPAIALSSSALEEVARQVRQLLESGISALIAS